MNLRDLRGWFQHRTPQFIANRRGPTRSRPSFCGGFRLKRGRSAVESRPAVARNSLFGPRISEDVHSSPLAAGGTLRPHRRSLRIRRGLSGQTGYWPAGLAPICRRRPGNFNFDIFLGAEFASMPARTRRAPSREVHARVQRRNASNGASPGVQTAPSPDRKAANLKTTPGTASGRFSLTP